MNRILILAGLLLVIITLPPKLFAQEEAIWIGIRGGCDLGTFHFSPGESPEVNLGWKPGVTVGIEWDYWFTDHIGMAVEPSFVQKGITETSNDPFAAGAEVSATFTYIQMPVLLKVIYGNFLLKPYLFIGPSLGYKLSTTATETFNGQQTDHDIADSEVTAINFSVIGGVGVSWRIGSSVQLFIESAYDFGLTNLDPNATKNNTSLIDNPYVYTRDIIITTGLLYRF